MKTRYLMIRFVRSRRLVASALASALSVLFAVTSVHAAATYTWDVAAGDGAITDGTATWAVNFPNWFDGSNYDQNWVDGNAAVFGGGTSGSGGPIAINGSVAPMAITFNPTFDGSPYEITGNGTITMNALTMSVSVPSGQATISAGINTLGTAPVTSVTNVIAKTGAGKLTLSGQDYLFGDVNLATSTGFTVDGGGELDLTGYLKAASGSQSNRGNFTNTIGATAANNTVLISGNGKLMAGGMAIGGGTFGGNSVTISSATPNGIAASSANPSYAMYGNGAQLNMGVSSSNNSFTVSGGAYLAEGVSGGTMTWTLGTNAGANGNTILVTGSGTTLDRSGASGSFINLGAAGSSNSVTVQSGGKMLAKRFAIGTNGGKNNFALITDPRSSFNADRLQIGTTNGATGNYFKVANNATASITAGNAVQYSIGSVTGADNNYVLITGTGSAFTLQQTAPLTIGGVNITGTSPVDSAASGNHFDVYAGASTTQNSVDVMGVNSALNLGDGTGISTATLGKSGTGLFVEGIYLRNASSSLNVYSGRLIAGVNGSLVSGAGQIVLNGPAYISTIQAASTIGSVISGVGSLSKEGSGTLTLAAGTNTYSGDTKVVGGTLELLSVNPNNHAAAVTIDTSLAKLNLNFVGDNVVGSLVINGVSLPAGTYGSTSSTAPVANQNDAAFAGTGTLTINGAAHAVTYASWAIDKGIGAALPNDDYDNDGVSNVVEMLVGGDPKSAMDAALLPKVALVSNPGSLVGDYLEFTYRRSALSVSAGVSATCQSTTDLLLPWTTATNGVNGVVVIETAGFYATGASAIDRVQVYVPRASHAMLFGRLQVTVP